jgi:hypothetical protein
MRPRPWIQFVTLLSAIVVAGNTIAPVRGEERAALPSPMSFKRYSSIMLDGKIAEEAGKCIVDQVPVLRSWLKDKPVDSIAIEHFTPNYTEARVSVGDRALGVNVEAPGVKSCLQKYLAPGV